MSARDPSPPARSMCAGFDRLEALLCAQLELHRALLERIERKRAAIRVADAAALQRVCQEEDALLRQLRESDAKRIALIAQLAKSLGLARESNVSVASLLAAGALEPAQRERIAALAGTLRRSLAEMQRQSSIVRSAAETLSRHLAGVMQTVHSALGRAGVYTQRGRIIPGAAVHTSLDLRS